MKTFQAQRSNSSTIYLACVHYFKWNYLFILSFLKDKIGTLVEATLVWISAPLLWGLCNSPALVSAAVLL